MRTKSELRNEILDVIEQIDGQAAVIFAELERLTELRQRGEEMLWQIGDAPAKRDQVESIGAWMDEVGRKN